MTTNQSVMNLWCNLHHWFNQGYDGRPMPGFAALLGDSPAFVALRDELRHLVRRYASARRPPPILLLGETGTGKTLIARALHAEGPRATHPFVDVACPEIAATLLESEMFGVERGAFTDARQSRPGRFAQADRGTIFLDEIGLLPDPLQAKLLKIVEDQQLRPLGATASRPIDVWVIAATCEDLEAAVRKRHFREDLYYRLAVVTLRVPPLRERGDDVVLLARHFLARACADYGLAPRTFSREALAALRAHPWRGNIRELANVIERVALRADGPLVGADVLGLPGASGALVLDSRQADPAPGIDQAVARLERQHLLDALAAAGDNVTRAARQLGLTRNTIRYRLRKHGIPHDRSGPAPPAAEPPSRPAAAPHWERRRVVFLRVALAPAPDEIEPRSHALLDEARQKVGLFGGALDSLSPAGLTAVFGLDLPEDAARRAAHAALAIRKLGVRAQEIDSALPAMSVAIHAITALLWRGADGIQVDAEARREAWRMLDSLVTGDASIVVSQAAAAVLRATFLLSDRQDRDDDTRLLLDGEPAPRPPGPVFVGRREDMAMLQGRLDLALAGRGQVVGIAGEPGIGKSRTLHEFRRALPADATTYVSAHAQSYGREVALLPIVELVRQAHGIGDGEAPALVRDKLEAGLKAVGLAAAELTPFLLRLIGIDAGTEAIAHLGPETLHRRTLEVFRDVVLATSRARPLVIAVEDLHWIDHASEAYLADLVDAIVEAPILLLTTFRSGYRPPWNERSYVSELRLQPLSRTDSRQVLEAALERDQGTTSLPAARAEAILDRADGNPFFIEELAWASAASSPGEAGPVPGTIEAVLLARVDRLADEPKRILQTASVLGRDVPVRLLEAVAADGSVPKEHLRELQRLEYLNDRSGGAGERYRFKHALTQEVAYASLLPADRRDLHARIMRAIEVQHAGRLAEQAERLAHHALHGELWQKAADYLRQVGRRATARGALHEAIACLEQGLAVLRHLPGGDRCSLAVDLRLDLHTPLMAVSAYRRALDHLAEAVTLAEALGERKRLALARAGQCLILRATGVLDEAIEAGQQARAIIVEAGEVDLAHDMNYLLASAFQMKGDLAAAGACYRESFGPLEGPLTQDRALGLPRYAAAGRAFLAWALEQVGKFAEGLAAAREALAIAELRAEPVAQVMSLSMLGKVHLGRGDAAAAITAQEKALVLCRSHDVRTWLSPVTTSLGFAYMHVGRLAEAIALLEEGVAHAGATGQMTDYPARIARLAQTYLLAGRHAEAAETVQRGTALARRQGQRADEAECLRVMGLVAAAAGPPRLEEAQAYSTQARDLAAALGMQPLVAHCHLDLGRLYRQAGRPDQAREHLAAASAIYRALEMPAWNEQAAAEARMPA